MTITSRKNQSVSDFKILLREKKEREKQNCFVVEGEKMIKEALLEKFEICEVMLTDSFAKKNNSLVFTLEKQAKINYINNDLSEYISDTKSPKGVFAKVKFPCTEIDIKKLSNIVILDGLQDSGNVGTIIRTCDAMGVCAVLVSDNCVDIFSPKTIRATMGSVFRVPIVRCDILKAIDTLESAKIAVFAAMLDETSQKLGSFKFPEKSAVIIGNEGSGISKAVANSCENHVYIPIKNAESLNAAIAASMILWEKERNG